MIKIAEMVPRHPGRSAKAKAAAAAPSGSGGGASGKKPGKKKK